MARFWYICANSRKYAKYIMVSIGYFEGIALFLQFPIVQNA